MSPALRTLIRLQNPFMKWLLRSPFHGLVSRAYMIITVTGRKSGHVYETPVQYAQEGSRLWVLSSEEYTWWRNLRGGAPVKILLRGHTYEACATPSTDVTTIRATIRRIYPSFASSLEKTAEGKVSLEIQIQEA
jgi:deazaflavin-dependent oxidoreductase (nitroreductase family)